MDFILNIFFSFWPLFVGILAVWIIRDVSKAVKRLCLPFAVISFSCSSLLAFNNSEYNEYYSLGGDYTTTHLYIDIPATAACGSYDVYIQHFVTWPGSGNGHFVQVKAQLYVSRPGGVNSTSVCLPGNFNGGFYELNGDETGVYIDVQHAWLGGGWTGSPFSNQWVGQSDPCYCQVYVFNANDSVQFGYQQYSPGNVTVIAGGILGGRPYNGVNRGVVNLTMQLPPSNSQAMPGPGQNPNANANGGSIPWPPDYEPPIAPSNTAPDAPSPSPTNTPPVPQNSPTLNPDSNYTNAPPINPYPTTPAPTNSTPGTDGTAYSTDVSNTSSTTTSTTYITNTVNGTNTVTTQTSSNTTTTTSTNSDAAPAPPTTPTISNTPYDPGGGAAAQPPTSLLQPGTVASTITSKLPALDPSASFLSSAQNMTYDLVFTPNVGPAVHYLIHFDRTPFPELRSLYLVCFNLTLLFGIYKFMRV